MKQVMVPQKGYSVLKEDFNFASHSVCVRPQEKTELNIVQMERF
jgi:hypothetical protein